MILLYNSSSIRLYYTQLGALVVFYSESQIEILYRVVVRAEWELHDNVLVL